MASFIINEMKQVLWDFICQGFQSIQVLIQYLSGLQWIITECDLWKIHFPRWFWLTSWPRIQIICSKEKHALHISKPFVCISWLHYCMCVGMFQVIPVWTTSPRRHALGYPRRWTRFFGTMWRCPTTCVSWNCRVLTIWFGSGWRLRVSVPPAGRESEHTV